MKRKIFSVFLAVVLVLSFSLVTAVPAAAATITVNPGESIQAAIDFAGSDDIISVAAGTYVEDLSIPGTKTNLELVGAAGAKIKGVLEQDWPEHTPAISVLATGVKIHGFTIESPDYSRATGNPHSSGITVGAANVEIYENAFIATDDGTGKSLGWCTLIETYGQYGGDVSGLNIHDNTFTSDTGTDKGSEGIFINYNLNNPDPVGTVTIANNTFGGELFRAISTERDKTTISGNTISSSYAPNPAFNAALRGIDVFSSGRNPNIDTVVITGNSVNGFWQGIRLGDPADILTNISVTNNTVEMNTTGIKVDVSADGVVVNNNSIIGNTLGVENADSINTLVATSNWWGTTVEAEITAMVSGLVDFSVFLTQAPTWVEMTATSSLATSPTVTTSDATAVAFRLATLHGELTSMGTATSVDVSFGWDTVSHSGDPSFYTNWTTLVQLTTTGTFSSAPIVSLVAGETYYFAARAQGNDVLDPVYGSELSFTTAGITTLAATDIGAYTATLNGRLEIGSATSVDVDFEWGLTDTYGNVVPVTPITMTESGDFSADLTTLDVGVLYHFQARGDISGDIGYGGGWTFTTAPRIGISVSPTSIDFGDIIAGHSSVEKTVTVTNEGDFNEIFTASLQDEVPAGFYTANLAIDAGTVALWETLEVLPADFETPGLVLSIPISAEPEAKTATLIFWAEAGEY